MGRARRFVFEQHRHHFIAGRGLLRLILGRYLEIEPDRLQFEYGPQGKPELTGAAASSRLTFNLSHSGGLALYAVTYSRQIGVDVEAVRQLEDMEMMAYRFFSATEHTALMTLPPEERPVGFFNCWTRKEAYIKAVGDGLMYPLHKFDVSLQPGRPAELLRVQNDPAAVSRWSLQHLEPAPGYVGALAVAGKTWQLACWQWRED
jgi:4'-phosphopantetheinyl transferase